MRYHQKSVEIAIWTHVLRAHACMWKRGIGCIIGKPVMIVQEVISLDSLSMEKILIRIALPKMGKDMQQRLNLFWETGKME